MTSINQDRIRQKLEQLRNPKKFNNNNYSSLKFTIKEGESKEVRMLQYPYKEDPFIELWFHYGVTNYGILCPERMEGKPCPICEYTRELWKSESEKSIDLARQIRAKQRFFAVVVDREDSNLEPKFWGFGKQTYEVLLEYLLSEDYRDYLDPVGGRDFTLKCQKTDQKARFATTIPTPRAKNSALSDDGATVQKVLGNIKSIDELHKPTTVSEMQEALNKMQGIEAEDDNGELLKGNFSTDEDLEADFENAVAEQTA